MRKYSATAVRLLLLLIVAFPLLAQREQVPDQTRYAQRFFEQLRSLFGRFRDGDLKRAFDTASPIHCSDLVSGSGEWRSVAFFNEDRKLGDWYHGSLAEVNGDLSKFTFQGSCTTDQSSVQLATKFPIKESLDRYIAGRIRFNEVRTNANPAVRASFDPRSQTYQFDLPYLYAVKGKTARDIIYSLFADHADDHYATNVTNQWECKSVHASDLTFQFLICDTWTGPHNLDPRSRTTQSFGAAAYFILSDGKEASTSMKLSFGDGGDGGDGKGDKPDEPEPEDRPAAPAPVNAPLGPLASWQIPSSTSKLAEVDNGEFRIRFSPQTWANKIASAQVLRDQKMSTFDAAKPPAGVDYCVWRPASATLAPRVLGNEPDADIAYTLTTTDTSISFEMKTHRGSRLGALQCFFPGADAQTVSVDRWVAVVGGHLTIEVLP